MEVAPQKAADKPALLYIEHEGALFRGPARGVPTEVWDSGSKQFVPYTGSADKEIDWGTTIDEAQAKELMSDDQSGELQKSLVSPYVRADGTPVASHFRRAEQFSAKKHEGQFRKDGKTPYASHPAAVAQILQVEGGVDDDVTLSASLLHDTIEDTSTTYEELRTLFGRDVADAVMEVTHDPKHTKPQRKQAQIDKAPTLSARAAQIKVADKIANLRDIVNAPPIDWSQTQKREYYDHANAVVTAIVNRHPALHEIFADAYRKGIEQLKT